MRLWASFSATDINNDHLLDMDELSDLLWIYEGSRPSEYRVEEEKILINKNRISNGNKNEISRRD